VRRTNSATPAIGVVHPTWPEPPIRTDAVSGRVQRRRPNLRIAYPETILGKFAFGDRTIPIHARTLGPHLENPNAMSVYYGTVQ
jgi:hypothetical protein